MSALTKILIVLSTVFSIVLSVIMVLMVSKQENYKSQVDSSLTARYAAVAELVKAQDSAAAANAQASQAQQLASQAANDLQTERARNAAEATKAASERLTAEGRVAQLQTQLATANSTAKTLADANTQKDKQLSDLLPQVARLNQQNTDLYKSNQEAQNQLRAAEQALRKLQEQIAAGPTGTTSIQGGSDGQVQTMSPVNVAHAPINAKISNIAQSAGRTLIDLPLGTRDGVQVNTKLMIYRSTGYVGEAVVQRATADESVAVVTTTKPGETVRNDDMVSTDK